jgi:hypothetical protein
VPDVHFVTDVLFVTNVHFTLFLRSLQITAAKRSFPGNSMHVIDTAWCPSLVIMPNAVSKLRYILRQHTGNVLCINFFVPFFQKGGD